jgi:hypothetical protein
MGVAVRARQTDAFLPNHVEGVAASGHGDVVSGTLEQGGEGAAEGAGPDDGYAHSAQAQRGLQHSDDMHSDDRHSDDRHSDDRHSDDRHSGVGTPSA